MEFLDENEMSMRLRCNYSAVDAATRLNLKKKKKNADINEYFDGCANFGFRMNALTNSNIIYFIHMFLSTAKSNSPIIGLVSRF